MMGEQASSCGSISQVSSFSLCFSSLQVFHIWSFLFIRRLVLNLLLESFACWWVCVRLIWTLPRDFSPGRSSESFHIFAQCLCDFLTSLSYHYRNWICNSFHILQCKDQEYKRKRHCRTLNELFTSGKIDI